MSTKKKKPEYYVELGGFFLGDPPGTFCYLRRTGTETPIAIFGGKFREEALKCCDVLNQA